MTTTPTTTTTTTARGNMTALKTTVKGPINNGTGSTTLAEFDVCTKHVGEGCFHHYICKPRIEGRTDTPIMEMDNSFSQEEAHAAHKFYVHWAKVHGENHDRYPAFIYNEDDIDVGALDFSQSSALSPSLSPSRISAFTFSPVSSSRSPRLSPFSTSVFQPSFGGLAFPNVSFSPRERKREKEWKGEAQGEWKTEETKECEKESKKRDEYKENTNYKYTEKRDEKKDWREKDCRDKKSEMRSYVLMPNAHIPSRSPQPSTSTSTQPSVSLSRPPSVPQPLSLSSLTSSFKLNFQSTVALKDITIWGKDIKTAGSKYCITDPRPGQIICISSPLALTTALIKQLTLNTSSSLFDSRYQLFIQLDISPQDQHRFTIQWDLKRKMWSAFFKPAPGQYHTHTSKPKVFHLGIHLSHEETMITVLDYKEPERSGRFQPSHQSHTTPLVDAAPM